MEMNKSLNEIYTETQTVEEIEQNTQRPESGSKLKKKKIPN